MLRQNKKQQASKNKKKKKNTFREYTESLLIAFVAAMILRALVIESYHVPTGSMERTVLIGDFLLVNKFIYGARTPDWLGIPLTDIGFSIPYFRFPSFRNPDVGDIVVFKYPKDPKLNYVKRCIAIGGQTVELRDKVVFVDGKRLPDAPHVLHIDPQIYPKSYKQPDIYPPDLGNRDNYGPVYVPEDHYFMMGDNRENSLDSRYWGFVPKENIVGQALIIYFSWDKFVPLSNITSKIRWSRIGSLID